MSPDTALHLCFFPSLTMSCGSSQKAGLCITTYTNNPDPSGFPHAYPGDLMDFPQDSNPKERVSLLASDQSTLLSPLFKYFILSSVLTHTLSHVLTSLLCIFTDTSEKFSETNTQEQARSQSITTMNMPLHRSIEERNSVYHYLS